MKKHGYSRAEKLKNKKEIALLFEKGKWKSYGSLRMIILPSENLENNKVGVSVSKRHFKKAVDRNRIKRLLREVYRLNKDLFNEKFGEKNLIMLFWVSPEKPQHYLLVEKEFLEFCGIKK